MIDKNQVIAAFGFIVGFIAYEYHVYTSGLYYFTSFLSFLMLATIWLSHSRQSTKHRGLERFGRSLLNNRGFINHIAFILWLLYCLFVIISGIYNVDLAAIFRGIVAAYVLLFILKGGFSEIRFHPLLFILGVSVSLALLIEFNFTSFWRKIELRNASILFDPNYYALFCGIGFFLGLQVKKKLLKIILLPAFFFALLLTGSRGAFISLMITIILCSKWRFMLSFIIISSLFIFWDTVETLVSEVDFFRYHQDSNGRHEYWLFIIKSIFDNGWEGLFGLGSRQYEQAIQNFGGNGSVHNAYFEQLGLYGLVPFFSYMLFIIFLAFLALRYADKFFMARIFLFIAIASNFVVVSFGGVGLVSLIFTISGLSLLKYLGGVNNQVQHP